MAEPFFPLTALSEAQRVQALERFTIIRPALEEGVSRAQVARTSQIAPSTVQLWIKRYREKGLAGLANNIARGNCAQCSNENTGLRAIASNIERIFFALNVRHHFHVLPHFHRTYHFSNKRGST